MLVLPNGVNAQGAPPASGRTLADYVDNTYLAKLPN
jgi:hypothetical protein